MHIRCYQCNHYTFRIKKCISNVSNPLLFKIISYICPKETGHNKNESLSKNPTRTASQDIMHLLSIGEKVLLAISCFNGASRGAHKVNTEVLRLPLLQKSVRLIVVNAKLIKGF